MDRKHFKFIKHLVFWIIVVFLFMKINDDFIRNIITNLSMIAIVVFYMFPRIHKTIETDIKKESSNKAKNLYIWTDNLDGGDNYLRFLFKSINSNSIPSNLNEIYGKLKSGNSVKELRLLRAFFKAYKDRQAIKIYYKSIGSAILSFIIFSLQALVQGKIKNENYLHFIQPSYSWGFVISVILIALYYFLLPHREENRLNLVVNILDEIIDIEDNKE